MDESQQEHRRWTSWKWKKNTFFFISERIYFLINSTWSLISSALNLNYYFRMSLISLRTQAFSSNKILWQRTRTIVLKVTVNTNQSIIQSINQCKFNMLRDDHVLYIISKNVIYLVILFWYKTHVTWFNKKCIGEANGLLIKTLTFELLPW